MVLRATVVSLGLLFAVLLNPRTSVGQDRFSFEAGAQGGFPSDKPLERHLSGVGSVFSSYEADNARYLAGPTFVFMVDDRFGGEVGLFYKPFDIRSIVIPSNQFEFLVGFRYRIF